VPEGNKRKILNISLPPELYREVERLGKEQAKAKDEFVREVLRQYVETDTGWKQIRKWGMQSAEELKVKGDRKSEEIRKLAREGEIELLPSLPLRKMNLTAGSWNVPHKGRPGISSQETSITSSPSRNMRE
jgi:predicted transcriptional regulator